MVKIIREKLLSLLKSNTTPEMVALGVSMGVFIGVIPIYGFHSLLALFLALLIPRVNKIAILLGANISLPPIIPVITWAGYEIGRLILPKKYPPLSFEHFNNFSCQKAIDLYCPLFIGSVILGLFCAVVFYYLILYLARVIKKRAGK